MSYFITGTDTGVGKTYFTSLLTRALRQQGLDTLPLKPLCSGDRDDVDILRRVADHSATADEINPIWLAAPTAPLVAARRENRTIDFEALVAWFSKWQAQRQSLLVEGAGGWLVPITETHTIADLAVAFQLPVLIVVANRLGCLNHALLTVESVRARGLSCAGLILNSISADDSIAAATNRASLEEICDVPILAELVPGQDFLEWPVKG